MQQRVTIRRVDIAELKGFWRDELFLGLGKTLATAGRTDEALAAYRNVLSNGDARSHRRKAAEEAIRKLTSQ